MTACDPYEPFTNPQIRVNLSGNAFGTISQDSRYIGFGADTSGRVCTSHYQLVGAKPIHVGQPKSPAASGRTSIHWTLLLLLTFLLHIPSLSGCGFMRARVSSIAKATHMPDSAMAAAVNQKPASRPPNVSAITPSDKAPMP